MECYGIFVRDKRKTEEYKEIESHQPFCPDVEFLEVGVIIANNLHEAHDQAAVDFSSIYPNNCLIASMTKK